jgi:hypothetical protein
LTTDHNHQAVPGEVEKKEKVCNMKSLMVVTKNSVRSVASQALCGCNSEMLENWKQFIKIYEIIEIQFLIPNHICLKDLN